MTADRHLHTNTQPAQPSSHRSRRTSLLKLDTPPNIPRAGKNKRWGRAFKIWTQLFKTENDIVELSILAQRGEATYLKNLCILFLQVLHRVGDLFGRLV